MTPQDHNKVLAILHLVYGGFNTLMGVLMVVFFGFILGVVSSSAPASEAREAALVFGILLAVTAFILIFFGLLPLIAGLGMLRRKPWAKTLGIISSFLAAMNFPFGTALCVYTVWFLLGEGKSFHQPAHADAAGQWRGSLRDAPAPGWDARSSTYRRRHEYVPPPQPPNWRDDG